MVLTHQVILVGTAEIQHAIYRRLAYRKSCRGRALITDIPLFSLKKHDRILPTKDVLDVSDFEKLVVPFIVTFWRMTKNDRVFHNCPLLTMGIPGLTYDKWGVDGLHSWALGGLGASIAHGLRFCIRSPVFRPLSAHLDNDDMDRLAMNHIKSLLMVHYKKKKEDPEWKKSGTEVSILQKYSVVQTSTYQY